MVTANCEVTGLDSDIIVWKLRDPNGNYDDPCDDFEVWPDDVEITIKSKVHPVNELETSSSVRIENVRIDYEPWSDTPSLASRHWDLGQIVEPNSEVSLSIVAMGTDQKNGFLDDPDHYNSLITDDAYYTYDVTLNFSVVKIIADKKGNVSTNLTMQVHDYICAEEGDVYCDDECVHP